jgi:hypothetical protein
MTVLANGGVAGLAEVIEGFVSMCRTVIELFHYRCSRAVHNFVAPSVHLPPVISEAFVAQQALALAAVSNGVLI